MLITEFIDRTGYRPTEREYREIIEPAYYAYPYGKDEFCRDCLIKRLQALHIYIAGLERRIVNGEPLSDISLNGYCEAYRMQVVFAEKLILLQRKIYGIN